MASLKAGSCYYHAIKMDEQVVNTRFHWLPLYFKNSLLHEIFSMYGEVMSNEL